MNVDAAELSSMVTQLEDLAKRLERMAAPHLSANRADVASRLIEVERSLSTAARRLTVLQRTL